MQGHTNKYVFYNGGWKQQWGNQISDGQINVSTVTFTLTMYLESQCAVGNGASRPLVVTVHLHLRDPNFTLFEDVVAFQPEMFVDNVLETGRWVTHLF